ncbi:Small heat shock protein C4 [Gracilariopsis chorda]|uniref:Small heat shock protein C4 n=1 Tax=Gracilariopsis chorda TaxID=448386 RepID=A0A2V3J372_9FLOR|nr:Small heat shock protein C4 [Gracilariopsis chorda]|eukprot:PXF48858.1 Small heat shock protein C4 [Gracilariopsis chorda]
MALSDGVFDPFFPLPSFDSDMRPLLRLADRVVNAYPITDRTTIQVPNYEYQRNNDKITLQVELPGVAKEHIDVEMNSGKLTITARRLRLSHAQPSSKESEQSTEENEAHEAQKAELSQMSRLYKLQVRISTNVDDEGIKAEYNHGILNMILPLKKIDSARRIAITDQ